MFLRAKLLWILLLTPVISCEEWHQNENNEVNKEKEMENEEVIQEGKRRYVTKDCEDEVEYCIGRELQETETVFQYKEEMEDYNVMDFHPSEFCENSEGKPIVKVKQGLIQGIRETSLEGKLFSSFMGVPFASPPVGSLRFKEPLEAPLWNGILETAKMPPACLQFDILEMMSGRYTKPHGKEDCLYLNVYTPKPNCLNEKLPVMVFIHGGGFLSGESVLYTPHILLNEDIVLVVLQYRLNVFGFLSTEDSVMPGNMGIKDQILALKWVQENIINFGGDPNRVTIFGESAGGASSHIHMISPASKGLFHGVIAQSGTSLCPWVVQNIHKVLAEDLGNNFGCPLNHGTASYMECLQRVDGISLLKFATSKIKWEMSPLYTAPRVDGDIIPDDPAVLIRDGKYNKVNFISGTNRDEGAFVTLSVYGHTTMLKDLRGDIDANGPLSLFLNENDDPINTSSTIFQRYLQGKEINLESADQLTEMYGERWFKICHELTSLLHAKEEIIEVYMYEIVHRGQYSICDFFDVPPGKHWVSHADELFYLFNGAPSFSQPFEMEDDIKLRKFLTKLWTNFARTGNPTPDESLGFIWKKATPTDFDHLSLSPNPKMEKDNRNEVRNFWFSLNTRQNKLIFR